MIGRILLALLLLAPAQAWAQDRFALSLGSYVIDGEGDTDELAEARLAYESGYRLWKFGPYVAASINQDKTLFGSVGAFLDLSLGGISVRPFAGAGAYSEGDGRPGGVFEFDLGGMVAYRFDNKEIGITVRHISNGGLYEDNPGINSVMLTFTLELER